MHEIYHLLGICGDHNSHINFIDLIFMNPYGNTTILINIMYQEIKLKFRLFLHRIYYIANSFGY